MRATSRLREQGQGLAGQGSNRGKEGEKVKSKSHEKMKEKLRKGGRAERKDRDTIYANNQEEHSAVDRTQSDGDRPNTVRRSSATDSDSDGGGDGSGGDDLDKEVQTKSEQGEEEEGAVLINPPPTTATPGLKRTQGHTHVDVGFSSVTPRSLPAAQADAANRSPSHTLEQRSETPAAINKGEGQRSPPTSPLTSSVTKKWLGQGEGEREGLGLGSVESRARGSSMSSIGLLGGDDESMHHILPFFSLHHVLAPALVLTFSLVIACSHALVHPFMHSFMI